MFPTRLKSHNRYILILRSEKSAKKGRLRRPRILVNTIDNGCEEGFQGILKDMLAILYPKIDSIERCKEAFREIIEFYMNEYPQERFKERTAAEVLEEAFRTKYPKQYPSSQI